MDEMKSPGQSLSVALHNDMKENKFSMIDFMVDFQDCYTQRGDNETQQDIEDTTDKKEDGWTK